MVSHMGNEQTGHVHVFQLDPHCIHTTNLHTNSCPLLTAMVHVHDVSSALKTVTVHGPVTNT
jgi:hypothetical protein